MPSTWVRIAWNLRAGISTVLPRTRSRDLSLRRGFVASINSGELYAINLSFLYALGSMRFESLGTCARAFRPFSHEPDHATSRCAVSNCPSLSTAGLPDLNDWDRRYWDGPRLVTNPPATLVILLMVSGHLYTASANIGGGHHGNVWRFQFSFNMLAGVSDTGTSAVVPAPPIPSQAYRC